MSTTTLLHTTQLISLSTSLFLSGINFGASHLTLPTLYRLDAQTVSPAAFASLYHRGARLVVPLAILSALTSALVAAQLSGSERIRWIVAAGTMFASLPFTKVVMMETDRALLGFADQAAAPEELVDLKGGQGQDGDRQEVVRLLRRWKRLNVVRSAFALVSGLVATVTVVYRS